MKKLQKLQVNSEKIMNNEDLKALKGGSGIARCYLKDGSTCFTGPVPSCETFYCTAYPACNNDNFDYGICTGW